MKQAINTRTQEEYDALIEYGKQKRFFDPSKYTWGNYKSNTCIVFDSESKTIRYSPIDFWKKDGYTIIPYTEFAKANIVEAVDYKALYLEGRELLENALQCFEALNTASLEVKEIKQFLKKHDNGE